MPEPFRHQLRVRYHECDQQGVVFNAHYLAYCDICLIELWRDIVRAAVGPSADDIDLVVAEATVRFLAPLLNDDRFELRLTIPRLGTTSMDVEIEFDRDGETLAAAELRQVFVDRRTGEKMAIPDDVRSELERYATEPARDE